MSIYNSLSNCYVSSYTVNGVVYNEDGSYTAQEFPGDVFNLFGSNFGNALSIQQVPPGAQFTQTEQNNAPIYFYLVIKANPGYHIRYFNIYLGYSSLTEAQQNVPTNEDAIWYGDEAVIGDGKPAKSWSGQSWEAMGIDEDDLFGGPGATVVVYDSLSDADTNINNEVIVQLKMNPNFVMPSSNHTISLDLGGYASEYQPPQPDTPDQALGFLNYRLYITNYDSDNEPIYVARYYDTFSTNPQSLDDYGPLSFFNIANLGIILGEGGAGGQFYTALGNDPSAGNLPEIDAATGSTYGSNFPDNYTDCVESFQPTCYSTYANPLELEGFYDDTNAVNINTECGQLMAPDISQAANSLDNHPNTNPSVAVTTLYKKHATQFRFTTQESALNFATFGTSIDINFLGNSINPQTSAAYSDSGRAMDWYISLGNNSNYELIADSSFIDVYKIITIINHTSGNGDGYIDSSIYNSGVLMASESIYPQPTCPVENEDYDQLLISDDTQNNSHLDINNVILTQIDDTTVRLTIKLNSNAFPYTLYNADGSNKNTTTKIFLEINPTEI
tara:strand:- start:1635 stop:3311 length:1677 start_codon:yes stop_codon:yes gene_type:complete